MAKKPLCFAFKKALNFTNPGHVPLEQLSVMIALGRNGMVYVSLHGCAAINQIYTPVNARSQSNRHSVIVM